MWHYFNSGNSLARPLSSNPFSEQQLAELEFKLWKTPSPGKFQGFSGGKFKPQKKDAPGKDKECSIPGKIPEKLYNGIKALKIKYFPWVCQYSRC